MNKIRAILARPVPVKQRTVGTLLISLALAIVGDLARKSQLDALRTRIAALETNQDKIIEVVAAGGTRPAARSPRGL